MRTIFNGATLGVHRVGAYMLYADGGKTQSEGRPTLQ